MALIDYLSTHPFAGNEIPCGGGVRKVRFATTGNRGKSGGARVIYFVYNSEMPLVLISCYGKNAQANLSGAQLSEIAKLVAVLKAEFRGKAR